MECLMEQKKIEEYLGKRVVITTLGNVSYAGTFTELYISKKGIIGCFVETDSLLGVCIWCPLQSVKEIVHIPIIVSEGK